MLEDNLHARWSYACLLAVNLLEHGAKSIDTGQEQEVLHVMCGTSLSLKDKYVKLELLIKGWQRLRLVVSGQA